jgi:tetratricopeptide (TPR) repeat protein
MLLTARVVDVETGRILLGERVEGRAEQFDALVSCLSQKIAGAVDARLPAPSTAQAPVSLDAMLAYARGLALEETEDYGAALQQYQLALQLAPDYEPAQLRMEEGVMPLVAMNN